MPTATFVTYVVDKAICLLLLPAVPGGATDGGLRTQDSGRKDDR